MLRLLINLDRSQDRLQVISKALTDLGLSFSRVQAIDGKKLTEEEVRQWTIPKAKRHLCCRDLTRTEIACCLSHRKCWQMLVDSNEEWALILEDDCIFSDRAREFMADAEWMPATLKLCQLAHIGHSGECVLIERRKVILDDKTEIIRIIKPHHVGAATYLIHRDVAQLALELTGKLEAPVDEVLFSLNYPIGRKYAGWVVNTYPVRIDHDLESTIGHGEENEGYGDPCTESQRWRKVFTRIRISLYRKFRGVWAQVRFE